jgi:hypothetical protein
VGELARPVSGVADELGVCWWTVMHAVERHGRPLVDDPARVGPVVALGVDETSFLKANREHPIIYATGLVDLNAKLVIDMVEGNAAKDLRRWCASTDVDWLKGIKVVATDLAESYRAGLSPHLDHAVRVADPFHVVRVANRCLDTVRRRVQNELLGHRGRKDDPLYRIRKLLVSGAERLDERGSSKMLLGLRLGDPDDAVLGTWLDRSQCVTSISPTIQQSPPCCWTRRLSAASPTRCPRSARSATRSRPGGQRSSTTIEREPRTAPPRR